MSRQRKEFAIGQIAAAKQPIFHAKLVKNLCLVFNSQEALSLLLGEASAVT